MEALRDAILEYQFDPFETYAHKLILYYCAAIYPKAPVVVDQSCVTLFSHSLFLLSESPPSSPLYIDRRHPAYIRAKHTTSYLKYYGHGTYDIGLVARLETIAKMDIYQWPPPPPPPPPPTLFDLCHTTMMKGNMLDAIGHALDGPNPPPLTPRQVDDDTLVLFIYLNSEWVCPQYDGYTLALVHRSHTRVRVLINGYPMDNINPHKYIGGRLQHTYAVCKLQLAKGAPQAHCKLWYMRNVPETGVLPPMWFCSNGQGIQDGSVYPLFST